MDWEIKVASYNIHKAIGRDRRRSPERILAVLAEIDADVVVLQEADLRFGARQSVLPPAMIAAHSPYRHVTLTARPGGLGWHGNAVLVRDDALVHNTATIALPALEPRGSVAVELEVKGERVRIIGMHLDLTGLRRRAQSKAIVDRLNQLPVLPTIVVGDTNEWRRRGGCLDVFYADLKTAPTGPSFPAIRPMLCLDRVFVDHGFDIVSAGVHATATARMASDHLPVWARLSRSENDG